MFTLPAYLQTLDEMENKMMMRLTVIFLLKLVCFTGMAQFNNDSLNRMGNADTLGEVVVTATRHLQSQFTTPYSIDKVNSPMDDMRNARTLPEALAYTPGVFIQKTNHGGGSPFLRGLTGNQTLLMLDGIRVNNAIFRFGPNQYPNLIDAYTLDRVEVLKGSGSAQYGSDAMGGVIHAITNDVRLNADGGWHARGGTRITSQDMEYTARAQAGYSSKNFGITGGYTWRQFGDLIGGDTTGRQSPSGYDERNWDLKAKWAINDQYTLTVSSQQVSQLNVPLYHRVALENFEYYNFQPQKMLISYARLQAKYANKALMGWSITPLYKKAVEGRNYHRNGNANYFMEQDAAATLGIVADADFRITKNWTSTSGVEMYRDRINSDRLVTNNLTETVQRGLYPDGSSQINASVYSLHHLNIGRWKFEAGLRYNSVTNIIPGSYLALPGQTSRDARLENSALVSNASVLYQLTEKHNIYVTHSAGFRAPGIDDLGTLGLVDFRYEVPAYDLTPEKNQNVELGYRFRNRQLKVHAAIFYMHISDLISRVRSGTDSIQGYPVFIKTNDQQAFIRGMEASVEYAFSKNLSLLSMVSAQHGQNLSRNEPVRRIPPTFGLTTLRYQVKKWYAAADHQWAAKQRRLAQGDKDDNRIPAGGTPAWQVVNIHGGYMVNKVSVRATLANIFNEDYRTHGSGMNGMGRALTVAAFFNIN